MYKLIITLLFFPTLSIFSNNQENIDSKTENNEYTTTVTAIKNGKNSLTTPYTVSTISQNQIFDKTPNSIGEMIKEISGVSILPKGLIMINPIIRGLGGRRVLMLIDGNVVDSNKTMGVVGYFVNLNDVEQIEVIKGPSSVLYGSGALGGVINIVSQNPFQSKLGFSGYLGGGYSFNNSGYIGNSKIQYNGDDYYISLSGRFRDADSYYSGGNDIVKSSYYSDKNLYFKSGFKIDNHVFSLDIRDYHGDNIGKAFDDEDFSEKREIYFPQENNFRASIKYQYDNRENKNILFNYFEQNLFYAKNDRVQRVDIFDNNFKNIQSYTTKTGDMWSLGGNAHTILNYSKKSNLIFGYDTLYKTLKSENNYYLKDFIDETKYHLIDSRIEFKDNNQIQIAFFAQNEIGFSDFTIITSIRGDYFKTEGFYPEKWDSSSKNWIQLSTTESSFSGNIGVLYSPISKFAIKLNLSRSFRAPDLREIFFAGANCYGYTCGNPNLKPENSLNSDFSIIFSPKWIDFEINSFIYFIDNFINFAPIKEVNAPEICELQYQNTNKAILTGFETKIAKKIRIIPEKITLQLYFSTSYIYAKDLVEDTPIASIPPFNINTGLKISGNIQKFGKYHFGLSINHENEQNRVADEESKTDAYTIYNIQSGLQIPLKSIFTQFKISFNIENIADLKYKTHLSTPYQIGREFKLNLQLSF